MQSLNHVVRSQDWLYKMDPSAWRGSALAAEIELNSARDGTEKGSNATQASKQMYYWLTLGESFQCLPDALQ